jgi:MFS family permease
VTLVEAQLATSLVVVGGWIGSIAGGPLSDVSTQDVFYIMFSLCMFSLGHILQTYGRRLVTLVNNWCFIIGAAMCSVSNKWILYGGRFIAGLGVGVECVVVPVLLSEMATSDTRGTITTVHQLLLTLGIFFVGILGYGLVTYVPHGWVYIQVKYMFSIQFLMLMKV